MRGWQRSGAATETPLDARGYIPTNMGSLEHGDRRTESRRDTDAGVPAAKPARAPKPAFPMPFHHPTLPSGETKGNQYRGKWVSHVTVWARSRREETERM